MTKIMVIDQKDNNCEINKSHKTKANSVIHLHIALNLKITYKMY